MPDDRERRDATLIATALASTDDEALKALPRNRCPCLRCRVAERAKDHDDLRGNGLVGSFEDVEVVVGAKDGVVGHPLHLRAFGANSLVAGLLELLEICG